MTFVRPPLIALLICLTLSLAACKKHTSAPVVSNNPAPASSVGTAATPPSPATAGSKAAVAAGNEESSDTPFDFGSVAEAKGPIPAFPYVTIPPKVSEGFLKTETVPMDRIWVILGDHLHAVEGRVATRTFHNSAAEMSELEIRRNYESAMQDIGAVKVNTVAPDSQALGATHGDEFIERTRRLAMPDLHMTYDVYLARKGDVRHWLVVMVGSSETRLIAIDEQPFQQTIGYVTEGGKTQPVTTLPPDNVALSSFPYLPYPSGVAEPLRFTKRVNFDAVQIIVGKQLRTVEGRVETRSFANREAGMSAWALRRNYEALVKGLGGVKMNAVAPDDATLQGRDSNKLRFPGGAMSYDSYLVSKPDRNVWLVLMFSDRDTSLLAVEEKAMRQTVVLITADDMRKELAAKGKVTLYINFDTDKATIRPDGKPAVDEITKLLKADPQLKLAIEGHTDDTGDAAHNQALSMQRAEAVVQSLSKDGIDVKRLRAAGHGATQPLADNKDEAGRAKNRRVELIKL
jgi:outer membrane protein OmpA-like peptidoglycan-associated protein